MEKYLPNTLRWIPIFLFVIYLMVMPLLSDVSYETTHTIKLAFVVLSGIFTVLIWIQQKPSPNKIWTYTFVLVMAFLLYSLY
jgi:hypothetical protein